MKAKKATGKIIKLIAIAFIVSTLRLWVNKVQWGAAYLIIAEAIAE
jgi:hypothetical protein